MKLRSRKIATIATIGMMSLSGLAVIGFSKSDATTKVIENTVDEKESDVDSNIVAEKEALKEVLVKSENPKTEEKTTKKPEEKTTKEQEEKTAKASEDKKNSDKKTEKSTEKSAEVNSLEAEYANKFVVNVDEFLNIRCSADVNAEVVGKLYAGSGGEVVQRGSEWSYIKSGDCEGFVANEFVLFGNDALAKAKEVGVTKVTVLEDGLRVRKAPGTDAELWGLADKDSVYDAVSIADGWVQINYEGEAGYISADYVSTKLVVAQAVSIAWEQEQARLEAERKAEEERLAEEARLEEERAAQEEEYSNQSQSVETVQTGSYSVGVSDEYLLACVVDAEAGCEPYEGKLAVANIVLNRLNGGAYGNTISDVVYARGQFSVTTNGSLDRIMASGPNAESQQAAREALSGVNNVPYYTGFCDIRSASMGSYSNYSIIGTQVFYCY